MSTSPDLGLPLISQQQLQPEVTHNEALLLIALAFRGVISITNTPPGSPVEGDSYIVGSAPTGAWAGRANCLTTYTSGGWRFLPDRNSSGTVITMGARHYGLHVWVRTDGGGPAYGALYVWLAAGWVQLANTKVLV